MLQMLAPLAPQFNLAEELWERPTTGHEARLPWRCRPVARYSRPAAAGPRHRGLSPVAGQRQDARPPRQDHRRAADAPDDAVVPRLRQAGPQRRRAHISPATGHDPQSHRRKRPHGESGRRLSSPNAMVCPSAVGWVKARRTHRAAAHRPPDPPPYPPPARAGWPGRPEKACTPPWRAACTNTTSRSRSSTTGAAWTTPA